MVVHASVYDGDNATLATMMSDAKAWYLANRPALVNPGCCGLTTTAAPATPTAHWTGSATLSDVTRLIDFVYISH